eukprot:5557065-Pleurochrysis_carterae.AAC.3
MITARIDTVTIKSCRPANAATHFVINITVRICIIETAGQVLRPKREQRLHSKLRLWPCNAEPEVHISAVCRARLTRQPLLHHAGCGNLNSDMPARSGASQHETAHNRLQCLHLQLPKAALLL